MPPPSLSWTRVDLHALVDALHLSRADWKHLTSLLPSRPPASIRSRLLAMLLPSSPAAKTWDSSRVARAALALHIGRPVSPLPSPPPQNSVKRRRGRVAVRVTPATDHAAAAVRQLGHNPCVEVVLRGVRPLWDVLKHLYAKWRLPLSLHDASGNHLNHVTQQVFALVDPDRPKEPLVLTFRLMHTKVNWSCVGPVHGQHKPTKRNLQSQNLPQFDPFASPAAPTKKNRTRAAPRAPSRRASKLILAPEQPQPNTEQKPKQLVELDLFASPMSNQFASQAPSRKGSPHGKRIAAAPSLDIDTFDPFASPLPPLKGKQSPRCTSRASTGSKRVSAPAPLEPSFDPLATSDRIRSNSRLGKRVWNVFDFHGPNPASPPVPPSKSAKRARVPWGDFDASGSAGQFATPTSSRQPLPLPPLPESLDGFSNSTAPTNSENAVKKLRIGLVDVNVQVAEQHGTVVTNTGTTPAVSASNEMHVPSIPNLLDPSNLGLMSPPPSGEKAVMKRLRRHLECLEGGSCEDFKSGNTQKSHNEHIVLRLGASCSGAAIPEAFLKSQSGLDIPLVAKLSDSMLSIGQSEGSVPATQPGSRASGEGSVAFDDGNASDGFGFGETSPTGPPAPFQGPDSSPPAANRSFGLGDVSLGLGSRPFGTGVAPDSHGGPNQSFSLSGLFREIT